MGSDSAAGLTYRPVIATFDTRTTMKQTIQHAALASAMLLAMAGAHAADSKQNASYGSETRNVAAFSNINLIGPFRVIVTPDAGNAIELSGPSQRLSEIETSVSGDTLTVRYQSRQKKGWTINFNWGKDTRQELTVRINAANLKSLRNAGSGDVDLQRFQGKQLTLVSDGPGDLRASGKVEQLSVTANGSGDLDLRSLQTGGLNLQMNGPGDVDAGNVTQDLNLVVNGSGDLDISNLHAGKVSASLHGPGSVALQGTAKEVRADISGSGDLDACSLSTEAASAVLRGPGEACLAGNIKKLDAEVHGSGDLEVRGLEAQNVRARLTGPGNMTLSGNAAVLSAQISGSGDLNAQQLNTRQSDVTVRGPGNAVVAVADKTDASRTHLVNYHR
ncbi:GIN domain-containing protein [Duganella sp. sic0402]|uniref:GIN domain-containing protein n=1 Tax=Duganella sp. sic0402 TaxID=2854786 RepID=UPI001E4EA98F|nr:DUF2807 domain-containing protein [Duganella sp. sic0402]